MKVSDEVMFLEEAFDVLNERYFESALQKIAITIQSTPRAHGHFTPWDSWDDSGRKIKEINLGAESLCRPVPDVIATLMHEMVHYYCHINGIKDTSRGNTYHNKRFKEECEKRALRITSAPTVGYSVTSPTQELIMLVGNMGWNDRIKLYRKRPSGTANERTKGTNGDDVPTKKKSSTRKYVCPKCGMSVRASKAVRIACMECGNIQMEAVDTLVSL